MISERTRALIVDPILADMDKEQREAVRDGRKWRSRWILAAGYVALAKALAMHGSERLLRAQFDVPSDERRAIVRTVGWILALTAVLTAVLLLPPLLSISLQGRSRFRGFYLVALIPQALPLALPMGVTLGIIAGLAGQTLSPVSKRTIVAIAAVSSLVSFGTIGWVMPASNQAFRTAAFRDVGNTRTPMRGDNELTLGELNREIAAGQRFGLPEKVRELSANFHVRWAIPCATLVLSVFALSLLSRNQAARRAVLIPIACGVFVGYYFVAVGAEYVAREGSLPPFAGVWFPNLLLSFCLLVSTYREHRSVIKPAH